MIRSSSYRTQCPRGRHSALEEKQEAPAEPFFVKAEKQGTANSTGQPFFQTKLNIGQPNDKYEQEADAVASKVVNNSGAGTVVQQKEITGIQRLSTSKEEEKAATADARMVKDREIQEKPEIQRLATDKQEEKLGTNDQRMRRDKEIQTKPEIQRMCPGCEQEEKDGSVVQRKKRHQRRRRRTGSEKNRWRHGNNRFLVVKQPYRIFIGQGKQTTCRYHGRNEQFLRGRFQPRKCTHQ